MVPTKIYDYKFIRFALPEEMARCIRLYAHSQNLTISQVLRSLITSWKDGNAYTEEGLINGIVHKAKKDWDTKQFVNPEADVNEFKTEWRKEMKKRLPDDICDRIIELWNLETMMP